MIKTLSAALALLGTTALAPALAADEEAAPLTIEEATQGASNVAIWKTGDQDTTVYLMGTIHILKPGLEWESDTFKAAWDEADTAYFEADVISPEAQQAAAPVVMSEAIYTDGTQFADLFSAEEAERINEGLAPYGTTVSSLNNMRPWFVSIQIAQLALSKAGGDPAAGIEMILGQRAVIEGKDLAYFETMTDQINMIASIDDEVWATAIVEGIDELENVEAYFAELIGLWYHGKADELADTLLESWDETPSLKTTLLDDRNKAWADELDRAIKEDEGVIFVAVGAGHLAGENSVQDYLEGLGHEIERVNP